MRFWGSGPGSDPPRWRLRSAAVLCAVILAVRADAPVNVTITIDPSATHQALAGFGQAENSVLVYPGPQTLSDTLRAIAAEKAYHQVGINTGTIGTLLESPGDYDQRRNDNSDPQRIDWSGFSSFNLDNARQYVVNLAKPFGFTSYFLGAEAPNVRWGSPWLADIRKQNYNTYLDETAEQVLANVTFWKNTYGEELPYFQLGNEQLSGNMAMINPDMSGYGAVDPVQQIVDITKRSGARLRAAGFTRTRFLVGIEESEETSLQVSRAILADPDARQYVGAIGYHSYPYYQGYSSIPFILSTSGAGVPDTGRIAVRNQIRDLAKANNVQVWMTENSHGGDPLSYDSFRGRAIQIHDEFLYADASAYFGEGAIWDLASQRLHNGNDSLYTADNEGNIVLVQNDTGAVDITGIGYAIGHYARWIKPGAVRVDGTSSDPLVQVTAFRDDQANRLSLVIINNSAVLKSVTVAVSSTALAGTITGEQSTASAYWKPLPAFAPSGPAGFLLTLPADSITSVMVPLGASGVERGAPRRHPTPRSSSAGR